MDSSPTSERKFNNACARALITIELITREYLLIDCFQSRATVHVALGQGTASWVAKIGEFALRVFKRGFARASISPGFVCILTP